MLPQQGFVLGLGAHGHDTPGPIRANTLESNRADAAIAFGELDLNHRIAADVNGRWPELTDFSCWTRGLLLFPAQFEILRRKPVAFLACLSTR